MIEVKLPPSVAALSKSCETICEAECCGLGAFNFSPFNIIYHLTRWNAAIRESDVAMIRLELTDLAAPFQTSTEQPEKIVVAEWNAIMTKDQLLALSEEIASAVTEACMIYASQKDQIDARYQDFHRIIKALD